jgi:Flp pilus assembly protein TadD
VVWILALAASSKADLPWRKTDPPSTPPAVPETVAPGTVAVNLTKAYDPNGFRKDVTQDQRIHVHIDFGRVFESQGKFEAALSEYQQALAACEHKGFGRSRSADEALAHRRMGNALDRLGRFAQAEMHYKQALKLSPRDPKIWNDAGYSYYLQGRWADAERTMKTGMKIAPEDVKLKTNLGLTLAAAGRTGEALPLLSQYSGDAIGHANLGYLLAATGQIELARQQYLQALALRPSLALARRALAQLDRAQDAESVARAGPPPPQAGTTASASTTDDAVLQAATRRIGIPPPRQFTFSAPPGPSPPGP